MCVGQPFRGEAFQRATPEMQSLYQALAAPSEAIDAIALSRIDAVASAIAQITREPDDAAARQAWIAKHVCRRQPAGDLVSHPFHAAIATPYAREPATDACQAWTIALLATHRLVWPDGILREDAASDACYRASLHVRRLVEDIAWTQLQAPLPRLPLGRHPPLALRSALEQPALGLVEGLFELMSRGAAWSSGRNASPLLPRHRLAPASTSSPEPGRDVVEVWVPSTDALTESDDCDSTHVEGAIAWRTIQGAEGRIATLAADPCLAEDAADGAPTVRRLRGGRLTLAELTHTLAAIEALDAPPDERDRAQVVVLAIATLGIAPEGLGVGVRSLRTAESAHACDRCGLFIARTHADAPWDAWRVQRNPRLSDPPAWADRSLFAPVVDNFRVHVHPAIAHALATRLARLPGSAIAEDPSGVQVLTWNASALTLRAYERFVETIRARRPGHRLEAGRLRSIFEQVLDEDECVDDAIRALMLACPDDAPPTALFYTRVEVSTLDRVVRRAQARLVDGTSRLASAPARQRADAARSCAGQRRGGLAPLPQ